MFYCFLLFYSIIFDSELIWACLFKFVLFVDVSCVSLCAYIHLSYCQVQFHWIHPCLLPPFQRGQSSIYYCFRNSTEWLCLHFFFVCVSCSRWIRSPLCLSLSLPLFLSRYECVWAIVISTGTTMRTFRFLIQYQIYVSVHFWIGNCSCCLIFFRLFVLNTFYWRWLITTI